MSNDQKQSVTITKKQIQIIEMLAKGYQQDQIASELELTQDSIAYHIRMLKEKLNAKTLAHIVACAFRLGLYK